MGIPRFPKGWRAGRERLGDRRIARRSGPGKRCALNAGRRDGVSCTKAHSCRYPWTAPPAIQPRRAGCGWAGRSRAQRPSRAANVVCRRTMIEKTKAAPPFLTPPCGGSLGGLDPGSVITTGIRDTLHEVSYRLLGRTFQIQSHVAAEGVRAHSVRNACMGSLDAARLAGSQLAASATTSIKPAEQRPMAGSVAFTP